MTECWGTEGLKGLRDSEPEKIARVIMSVDMELELAYITAVAEYLSHGYPRKAAEVTRVLAKMEPSIVDIVNKRFDDQMANDLLKTKLEYLPSKPAEFPRGSIEYVQ